MTFLGIWEFFCLMFKYQKSKLITIKYYVNFLVDKNLFSLILDVLHFESIQCTSLGEVFSHKGKETTCYIIKHN